jgi:hypothetical protein
MKSFFELRENKIFFVKVGDGRDSMTVKTKASNSREALKNVRSEHPKDKVSLDPNQKQGQPAGTFESVNEATSKIKTTAPDKVASGATRFGLKAKTQGGHVSISGPKGKLNDFLRAIIGRSSYGNASELDEVYRKPTAAEIAADKAKERRASGSKGPDSSARYKSMKKKMYGNAMGGLKKEETASNLEEGLVKVTDVEFNYRDQLPNSPKPSDLGAIKDEWKQDRIALRDAVKKMGGLVTNTISPSRGNKWVGTVTIGTREDPSKLDDKSIQKAVKGHGIEIHSNQFRESTKEYGKSVNRIQAKKTRDSLTPNEKDKLAKLHALMKKQRKTGNYKMESADLEEQKYAVKYTHPTDKKSGRTTGPMSKSAADKKASMGNKVDKVGGKYTVIRHVEEVTEAKLSDMGIHNKIADRNLLIKAIKTAEKMGGNMTGAVREIEKMKKGLSKHKAVQAALQQANESVELGESKYNKGAVDKEIKKDRRIKGKESKAIHSLLKGRTPRKEDIELDEAVDFMKMSKELLKHKSKGIEFEKAAAYVRAIHNNSSVNVQDKAFMGLTKMLKDMDDFTKRTTITKILKDNGFRVKGGKLMREEVEFIDENYRTLATKGMGAETKNSINVGRDVDYYEPKNGDKRMGKITKMTKSGYVVKDEKDGKSYTFAFHDRAKAKALLSK